MTIRAIVVDDSLVVRRAVADVLASSEDIDVVGTAADGASGLRRIAELQPDVVTLDVEMPGMDGLETLGHIRAQFPHLPVIMYSTLTEGGARATLDALALGAVDYATKPSNTTSRHDASEHVRSTLVPLVQLWGRRRAAAPRAASKPTTPKRTVAPPVRIVASGRQPQLVVVGVSTGGPDALAAMLPTLPADLKVPVAIVQHMPPVFTEMLARRLDSLGPLPVSEAVDGEPARPGHVYLARGGEHLAIEVVAGSFVLRLTDAPLENSCRPAVDVLFRTATAATGGHLLGVILTGMGQDGLIGCHHVRDAGGQVLVQDEESSVVWGMPGYVARGGLADAVLPLEDIGPAVGRLVAGVAGTVSTAGAAAREVAPA